MTIVVDLASNSATLLDIVQTACKRMGLPVPAAVIGSADPQVMQLQALLEEEGQELSERYEWQELRSEATFTTVAQEAQTTLAVTCPGLKYIVNDTIWNRDLRRPIFGPLSAQRWQQLKALNFVGPWNQYQIRAGTINFIPAPTAGQTCAFYYQSRNWVNLNGGGTGEDFGSDADTIVFDAAIVVMGLIWRWKMAKGLPYQEDFNKYERRVIDAMAANGAKDVLNTGDVRFDLFPGILVPAGSWQIP